MTDGVINATCPFSGQASLPLPNRPANAPWYGIVPDTEKTGNVVIRYFHKDIVENKGWGWIMRQLVNPQGGNFTEGVLKCFAIVRALYDKGYVVEVGEWFFVKMDKN